MFLEIFAELHPPLVSFPFVLLFVALVLELCILVRKHIVSQYLIFSFLIVALVLALVSYFSGHEASKLVNQTFQIDDSLVGRHFLFAKLSLFALVPTVIFKYISIAAEFNRSVFKAVYILFLLASLSLVVFTGKLGGELVFDHGAGVRATLPTDR